MASRYTVSVTSRARTFRKPHIFQQPQRPRQPVLPLAPGSRSYSEGFLKSWNEKFGLTPATICVAIGGIGGFLGVGSTYRLVEFC
jgi:hypothetical protein